MHTHGEINGGTTGELIQESLRVKKEAVERSGQITLAIEKSRRLLQESQRILSHPRYRMRTPIIGQYV